MASRSLALVTGANRGIGAQIAVDLASAGYEVLLGTRAAAAADEVVAAITASGGVARAVQLDVTTEQDVLRVASEVSGLDVLVNNAGIALDGFDHEVVVKTLAVNFEGARAVTDALWPRLRDGARVVNVSSGLADEAGLPDDLRLRFEALEIEDEAVALIEEFADSVERGEHRSAGWPSSAYRVSKLGLNALTRVWDRRARAEGRGVHVYSMCPGWVRTGMGGAHAPRGVEEGADTAVWLAKGLAGVPSGGYFRDRAPADW